MNNSSYTGRGDLQVMALAEDGVSPIEGALVRVRDPSDGTILSEQTTDSSGQTAPLELPTPPLEESIIENDTRPYATYHVTIDAVGYSRLHIGGVQLLPGIRALQSVQMEEATPGGFNVRNLYVQPNTLWGDFPEKIPEASVKDLPPASGQVVLPEPVIPEFIIVHLGVPSDTNARNVWVRFTDYIKTVACCEIYSTWQEAAIRANVLAILSFALNRVFTEWYRGKGYDFTITNSTAYDQAFDPDATIFNTVSEIVDELFTTYVTKPDIRQPLLTQFCDGRRSSCNGLSQWGSQALAQQGLDALSILRRYYGSDVYLDTASAVEGVPMSYGGEPLTIGSTGSAVRTIQEQLNVISNNFPAIPKLRADAIFGEQTAAAVRTFQQIFQLPQNGIVDFSTWYSISNIYVSVAGLA